VPELPEVETVRDGLARHVLGRVVADVVVHRDYSVRRHEGGPADLAGRLRGRALTAAVRRGKYCWLLLDEPDEALLVHLGMSGQLLVRDAGWVADQAALSAPGHPHLRVRLTLDDGSALDFVDQRTFGHLSVPDLVPTPDGGPGGLGSARALLDQTLVSGIGNIYADEGLWRARLHYARPTATLRPAEAARVLDGVAEVMRAALAAGGTSFDSLYVQVNGASGYFDRSLAVYGREDAPCPRCGTPVRRDAFMNRSSYLCPRCQPRPRQPHP